MLPIRHNNNNFVKPTIMEPKKSIITINFVDPEHKFIISDNRRILGSFDTRELIKYLSNVHDFLPSIDITFPKPVIENYVCKVVNNTITLLNHLESPLMGNIELVMKLYKSISDFQKLHLKDELQKITDINKRNHCIEMIDQFNFALLNYALRLISYINGLIKDDHSKTELKTMLIKYAIAINYKITNSIKHKIELSVNEFKILKDDISRLDKLKTEINNNMKNIDTVIQNQNKLITDITNKLNNYIPNERSSEEISDDLASISNSVSQSESSKELSNTSDLHYIEDNGYYSDDEGENKEDIISITSKVSQ